MGPWALTLLFLGNTLGCSVEYSGWPVWPGYTITCALHLVRNPASYIDLYSDFIKLPSIIAVPQHISEFMDVVWN